MMRLASPRSSILWGRGTKGNCPGERNGELLVPGVSSADSMSVRRWLMVFRALLGVGRAAYGPCR